MADCCTCVLLLCITLLQSIKRERKRRVHHRVPADLRPVSDWAFASLQLPTSSSSFSSSFPNSGPQQTEGLFEQLNRAHTAHTVREKRIVPQSVCSKRLSTGQSARLTGAPFTLQPCSTDGANSLALPWCVSLRLHSLIPFLLYFLFFFFFIPFFPAFSSAFWWAPQNRRFWIS